MACEVLEPVTVRVLTRPVFDNGNIADFGLWQMDNAATLAPYWTEQGNALGLEPTTKDLDLWLKVQYDRERSLIRRRHLPHGGHSL